MIRSTVYGGVQNRDGSPGRWRAVAPSPVSLAQVVDNLVGVAVEAAALGEPVGAATAAAELVGHVVDDRRRRGVAGRRRHDERPAVTAGEDGRVHLVADRVGGRLANVVRTDVGDGG